MHYICLIYTTFGSVISKLPRYHMTPSTFLMSVSSASLSPSSKSTVRKTTSSGHLLFLCAATSHATSCSMMAEERPPPKSASATSFRCRDGRSARPHTVAANFDPQIGQEWGKYWNRKCTRNGLKNDFKMMKALAFCFFRCNLVECKSQPTPLAANQQLAISTERNASSLHRIENQCASNERFTEVGTLLLWCGPA